MARSASRKLNFANEIFGVLAIEIVELPTGGYQAKHPACKPELAPSAETLTDLCQEIVLRLSRRS
jgi:hypothetical protein